ncbi:venom carboxylesterase-6 [Aedes aegypti]|uniref:carboxylesterase n=1 Tax=Aedes aegypti TaxID=7159 RepID=A0A6I8TLM8_AEDAE|nr:venom carboxylesterase-6 [Aedes aegypti]
MVPPTVFYIVLVAISLTASSFANSASYSTGSEFREYAKYPPQPFVRIADGCLYGTYKDGLESGQFEAFFGIPYAKPPVGKLRFRNPVPVEPWTGYYDATYERSKCVQKHDARPHSLVEGNEDCLYLNLYRPKYIIDPLPVIIFIHGGIYASGSASFAEFGPERLMDTGKVIVVVIQYRLGVFGFLSTGDSSSPGNYGLKDQSMALRWVQNNIQSFGGDPKRVLLAGQCAGGAAVQMHMMSPLSRGAFSTAVSMSGSVFDFWNYNIDQARLARRQAAAVGIRNAFNISTDKLVEELRWIDAYELGESVNRLKYFYVHPTGLYQPVVEQYVTKETFLSEDSKALWAAGKYEQIPWVTGFLSNDGAADSLGIITNVTLLEQLNENSRRFIPRLAGGYAQNNSTQMLKDRYFSDGTHERWLTRDNYLNLQTLTTESTVIYGIIKSVKLHQAKSSKKAPISVYYFNFRGRYSQSYVYSYTRADFGVCHSDELLYLFRNTALAPDYPAGSPELVMAKELVDYYVKLVYNGITGPLCRQNDCQLLEFTNSNNPNSPVELKLVNGFDENMFNFWSEFYRLQEMGKHGVAY